MANTRRTVAGLNVGQQVAPSMQGRDPRARRAPLSASTPELTVAEPLYIDERGRLAIRVGSGLKIENGEIRIAAG